MEIFRFRIIRNFFAASLHFIFGASASIVLSNLIKIKIKVIYGFTVFLKCVEKGFIIKNSKRFGLYKNKFKNCSYEEIYCNIYLLSHRIDNGKTCACPVSCRYGQ
jgi:hypothetical protein